MSTLYQIKFLHFGTSRVTTIGAGTDSKLKITSDIITLWRRKTKPVQSDDDGNTKKKVQTEERFVRGMEVFYVFYSETEKKYALGSRLRINYDRDISKAGYPLYFSTKKLAMKELVKQWEDGALNHIGGDYLLTTVREKGRFAADGGLYYFEGRAV